MSQCWGQNNYGQLGYGHDDDIGDDADEMAVALSTVDWAQISTSLLSIPGRVNGALSPRAVSNAGAANRTDRSEMVVPPLWAPKKMKWATACLLASAIRQPYRLEMERPITTVRWHRTRLFCAGVSTAEGIWASATRTTDLLP